MVAISIADTVRVKNVAPPEHKYGTLKFFHGPLIQHQLESGEEKFVPYYIAKNWFGDVRSGTSASTQIEPTDNGPRTAIIPSREFEVARLHSHYGLHDGPSDQFLPKDVPQVEMYDLEGNRIKTVLEDPTGKEVVEAKSTVSQVEAQADMIRQLTERLNRLEGTEPATLEPGEEDLTPEPDIPTDDPI